MAETIIIRCTHCGEKIGDISYVPGEQRIGCPSCKKRTSVRIKKDGTVDTWAT